MKQISQSDISNFLNKTDFGNQVKNVTSNKNELNQLSKKNLKQCERND